MRIVHRRTEDEAIRFLRLRNEGIHHIIVKYTALLRALAAADAVPDRLPADLKDLNIDPLLLHLLADLRERTIRIPICLRTSVQH